MSTSLYYSAVRTTPLTDDEKAEVDRLIAVHNDEFPFDAEVLDLYPSDIPDTLLNGSTKISSDPTEVIPSLVYWFNALTEPGERCQTPTGTFHSTTPPPIGMTTPATRSPGSSWLQ